MESLPVAAGKNKWVLRLFPAGMSEENKVHLSCYLRVSDMNVLLNDEVSAKFTLRIHTTGAAEPFVKLKTSQLFDKRHLDWGWPQCVSLEAVKRALENSKDDSIHLECEFEIFHDWKTTEAQGEPGPKKICLPTSTISADLSTLLSMSAEDSFSDVTFIVNKTAFPAHKNILSARCKVFSKMFKSGMIESTEEGVTIDIEDTDEVTFKAMLHFIYTGECYKVTLQNKTEELLALADRYDLQCLKLMCEDVMLQRLKVDNAGEILALSDTYHSCQLKQCVLDYIVENFFQVLATDGFKDLCLKFPALVAEVHDAVAVNAGTKKPETSTTKEKTARHVTFASQKRKRS